MALDRPVRGTIRSEHAYQYDADWFAAELTAGRTYEIEVLGSVRCGLHDAGPAG